MLATVGEPPFRFDVNLTQEQLFACDPSLVYYPLVYITGRGAFSLSDDDLDALRKHISPGGATLFADAACGSAAFDAAFRRFAAKLLPDHQLELIPRDDELSSAAGFDHSRSQLTQAAGGMTGYPQLEGIKIDGHWSIIYSKYGVGCVLDRNHDGDCKGYVRADAERIALNMIIYSTLK
jgi:hypothetical protein